MKRIGLILFFLFVFILVYISKDEILKRVDNIYQFLIRKIPEIRHELFKIKEFSQPEIFLPSPLKVEKEEEGFLTKEGIIEWTNLQRKERGLSPLKENSLLNESARLKLEDMFKNQYFDHTSPQGVELKDLIEKSRYEFILIGENLAMGNFKDDQDLVLSWMESPGHRENILNKKYQEIGVAVKQGIFEGKKVWIAVQHFGKPFSACNLPDEKLKLAIEEKNKELENLEETLLRLKSEIEKTRPRWQSNLKEKIKEYNLLVDQYNVLLDEIQKLVLQYNNQVNLFNECIKN